MLAQHAAQLGAGVALEYDTSASYTVEVGTILNFTLRARDDNGDIIADWDQTGHDVELLVDGSMAEVDSSTRSWNGDSEAYTWLEATVNGTPLVWDSLTHTSQGPRLHYTVGKSLFQNGEASLTFTQTDATEGQEVVLSIAPRWSNLSQDSPDLEFTRGPLENFLVDLTTNIQGSDSVFLLRLYEFIVVPRDRFMNFIKDTTFEVQFSARFPAEFGGCQGLADPFSGTIYITGLTNYFVCSRISRLESRGDELQWILVHSVSHPSISGRTPPYEIIDHPPNPFTLLTPPDSTVLKVWSTDDLEVFTWEKANPQDPYTDIQVSRFNPMTFSDSVRYKISFVDAVTLARAQVFDANHEGRDTCFTCRHRLLAGLIDVISGDPFTQEQDVIWRVEATDGVYLTRSSPPNMDAASRPGFLLILKKDPGVSTAPVLDGQGFTLAQNYPNPFNPSTEITYSIPGSGQVQLVVTDLLGKEVRRLVDGYRAAGSHRVQFNAAGLPSGIYLYRLSWNDQQSTRRMTLLR